ncbi:MAG: BatA domain-containing protein [Alphaproteobacteria bacterium]
MTFLNPWLLLGALGVSLPIVAHMLNDLRAKRTDWAAMQFLNRSVRVRSRNIRVQNVLLLILRCLAVLLLMLAFTRPALTHDDRLSALPGERRAGVIIALDVSFSMQHSDGTATRLERAFDKIDAIAEHIHEGDPVSLILLADEHRVVVRNMIYKAKSFRALVRKQTVRHESLNVETIPKQLRELCEGMDTPQKEVYLVTDLQEKDWTKPSVWLHNSLKDLGEMASVFVVPVGGREDNVAVTRLELVSGVLRKGTSARYRATVHNYDEKPATGVSIRCQVDNVTVDSKMITQIPAKSSETVSLFVPFNNSGAMRISATVETDALPLDNQRRIVTMVRDKVSVLSVEGSSEGPSEGGSFLSEALHARSSRSDAKDLSIRSIPWVALPTMNLDDFDVILISDVPSATTELVKKLDAYVRAGNGLIWFAGDKVKAENWNKQSASCDPPLLPAVIETVEDVTDARGAGIALDTVLPDHPVCRPIRSLPEDLLSESHFRKVIGIRPNPGSAVVLKLAGGDVPILIEQSLGRGHVFMFTSSADPSWNNMALTPAFPMLVQQAITYMTGREFEKARTVGDSLSLVYDERPDVNDAVFNTPSAEILRVPVREYRNQYVAMLEQSAESGFYTAQVSLQSPAMPIAVNLDTAESDVACLSLQAAQASFDNTGFVVAASDDELHAAITDARTARALWRNLLMAGFVLLLVESLIAFRTRRKRLSGAKGAA